MTRNDLIDFAVRMIRGAVAYGDKGLICIPGIESKHGKKSDAFEGFARTFLLYAFLSTGVPEYREEADWFITGFEKGVPGWPKLDEIGQARVEAALIALGLDMTREWIWKRLSLKAQREIISWMAKCVGDKTYPQKNWLWFQIITETFLGSVDEPWSIQEIQDDLRIIDSLYAGDGWYSDGYRRAFDHYNGWVFHTFPSLWRRMMAADDLADSRRELDRERLSSYVKNAITLIGGDGAPLIQGRSLIYRFAAAAPFCAAVIDDIESPGMGQLKRAIFKIVSYFMNEPILDAHGCLTVGWHQEWPQMAQRYSCSGSVYWAGLGLMCLTLPEDHEFWKVAEQPLPIERSDYRKIIKAPGWCVSGTQDDGIVRVYNFGTDSSSEGTALTDSPLYARWAYSTHTFPLLDEDSWIRPKDNASVLGMKDGRRTHRTGWKRIEPIQSEVESIIGIKADLNIIEPYVIQKHHGAGYEGEGHKVGTLISLSVIHGKWEIRLDYVTEAEADLFEVSGWPVHGGVCSKSSLTEEMMVENDTGLRSIIKVYHGFDKISARYVSQASPLADRVAVPFLESTIVNGLHISGISFTGNDIVEAPQVMLKLPTVRIQWNDDEITTLDLEEYGIFETHVL